MLRFSDVELDEGTHEVRRAGVPIQLTATEFNLLRYFLLNPRRVLSKPQILDHVWHYDFDGEPNVVETYVSYLRKKLEKHGPPLIHTIRLVGYTLREPAPEALRCRSAAGCCWRWRPSPWWPWWSPGWPPTPPCAPSSTAGSTRASSRPPTPCRSRAAGASRCGGDPAGRRRGPGHTRARSRRPAVRDDAPGVSVELRGPRGTVTETFPGYQQEGRRSRPGSPPGSPGTPRRGTAPPEVVLHRPVHPAGGPPVRVLAVEQPDGAALVLGMSLSGTGSTLDRLVLIELVVAAVALAAAVLLGLWLVRVGLRPLADVEDTAERIAEGGLDQRVPGENDRTEVGRLARTLNVMLGRIQQAFAQRDATEARLRASEERMRRFVADASHELRTPLAAVSAYAELFERGASERPEDLQRVMGGIRGETSRMKTLVEDLLLLARLDEGRPLDRRAGRPRGRLRRGGAHGRRPSARRGRSPSTASGPSR